MAYNGDRLRSAPGSGVSSGEDPGKLLGALPHFSFGPGGSMPSAGLRHRVAINRLERVGLVLERGPIEDVAIIVRPVIGELHPKEVADATLHPFALPAPDPAPILPRGQAPPPPSARHTPHH